MTREQSPRIVIGDTNIFIALLAGPTHPFHENAVALFRRVAEGGLEVLLTAVVVAEIAYVARPALGWSRNAAAAGLVRLLSADGIVAPERETLVTALRVYAQHAKLDFVDAYVAATALRGGQALATFDRDIAAIDDLEVVAA